MRKFYPATPDNHHDISNPKAVIEELDRIEELIKWVSYIFRDGSLYEGTVWDDLAHGKGLYVAQKGLVRLEAKMRAEGKIISRDFMDPEYREWLEMDIEDSYRLADGIQIISGCCSLSSWCHLVSTFHVIQPLQLVTLY